MMTMGGRRGRTLRRAPGPTRRDPSSGREGDDTPKQHAAILAIDALHEGAAVGGPTARRLYDKAALFSESLLKKQGSDPDVRRALATRHRQAAAAVIDMRRVAQREMKRYFEALKPVAEGHDGKRADILAFNSGVTFARLHKLKVRAKYLGKTRRAVGGLIGFSVPTTGRWKASHSGIREIKVKGQEHLYRARLVEFARFAWDKIYSYGENPRTVAGDNVKGVAGIDFRRVRDHAFKKITKSKRPYRMRLNPTIASGISYVIEGHLKVPGDQVIRLTGYFMKGADRTARSVSSSTLRRHRRTPSGGRYSTPSTCTISQSKTVGAWSSVRRASSHTSRIAWPSVSDRRLTTRRQLNPRHACRRLQTPHSGRSADTQCDSRPTRT